ncbi:hypothetical protein ES703_55233 [subsurface metagenome]
MEDIINFALCFGSALAALALIIIPPTIVLVLAGKILGVGKKDN